MPEEPEHEPGAEKCGSYTCSGAILRRSNIRPEVGQTNAD